MRSRRRLGTLVAALSLVATAVPATVASAAAAGPATTGAPTTTGASTTTAPTMRRRPNIVFVLTDDLSSNLVTKRFMPHLWALRQKGTRFANYFVTDSLCCPSRASIFTGRLPHDSGVLNNVGPHGGYPAFERMGDEHSTFATDLRAVGYRTALMGKFLNRYTLNDPPPPGWTEWDVSDWGYPEFHYGLNEDGRRVRYGGEHDPGHDNYLTDVISQLGDGFVTNSVEHYPNHPFFLELATFAPHKPYTPPPRYAHLYPHLRYPETPAFDAANRNPPNWLGHRTPLTTRQLGAINVEFRKRAQSVRAVDDLIGDLVTTLRRTGALADTYFVFSSDNGLHMGEHRLTAGKLTAFEPDIHVPLVVVGPGVPEGRAVMPYAENIDLRPTFDALAGTAPAEPVDGRSLLPLLSNRPWADDRAPPGWPHGVVIEHHTGPVSPLDPDIPPPGSGHPPSYEAIRLPHALYVEYVDGERGYYDLSTDPYEMDNIYRSLPRWRAEALHREVVRLEDCHDAPACSAVTVPRATAAATGGRRRPGPRASPSRRAAGPQRPPASRGAR